MIIIGRSVGLHSVNDSKDVRVIQELLVKKGYKIRVDGICGPNTIKAIRKFQQHFMHSPDAKVDVSGKTIGYLLSEPGKRNQAEPVLPPLNNANQIGDIGGLKYNPAVMNFSAKGIALLKDYEKFRSMPYDDQTGRDIDHYVKGATIGYGYLITSPAIFEKYKNGITRQKAESLFKEKLFEFEKAVKKSIKVNLTQNEYDALVILCYNIGSHAGGFPTSSVVKIINGTLNGSLDDSWKAWRISQNKINSGLVKRRQTELNVYHRASYIRVN